MNDQAFQLLIGQLKQHLDDDKEQLGKINEKLDKLMAAHWMRKGSGIIISGTISLVVSIVAILLSR